MKKIIVSVMGCMLFVICGMPVKAVENTTAIEPESITLDANEPSVHPNAWGI